MRSGAAAEAAVQVTKVLEVPAMEFKFVAEVSVHAASQVRVILETI